MRKPQRYQMKPNHIVDLLSSANNVNIKLESIEAMQLKGNGPADIDVFRWLEDAVGSLGPEEILSQTKGVAVEPATGFMMIATTTDGVVYAIPGDWVIRYPNGNFAKCEPDEFEATYDPIKEN